MTITGITANPATFFRRPLRSYLGYVRAPIVLPMILPDRGTSDYEKSLTWRDCRSYVEAALVRTSDPKAPLVAVPAGGRERLEVLPGAPGALNAAEHFIRRIVASSATVDMEGLMVHVNLPLQEATGSYAAAILLAAVSLMTQVPIVPGSAAIGELAFNGVVLPVPFPIPTCNAAAKLTAEVKDCSRLLLSSVSAEMIIPSTGTTEKESNGRKRRRLGEEDEEEPKVDGVAIVGVDTVADLLAKGLEWDSSSSSLKASVLKAVMTPMAMEQMPRSSGSPAPVTSLSLPSETVA